MVRTERGVLEFNSSNADNINRLSSSFTLSPNYNSTLIGSGISKINTPKNILDGNVSYRDFYTKSPTRAIKLQFNIKKYFYTKELE